jgi:hypothetical protein
VTATGQAARGLTGVDMTWNVLTIPPACCRIWVSAVAADRNGKDAGV